MSWHNTVLQCLLIPLWFLLQPSLSQSSQCTFFCPSQDELGQALLTQPLAIPYQSDYSVFECVYGEGISDPETHSCFYIKSDGKHALDGQKDQCPAHAIPCSNAPGSFSSYGKPEVPAWIENGRSLLYLKENHT
ncbi:hypothetical protein Agabi119p4_3822 [Agaricus bisporus var. burnettii]|uniref:Uncharacterized protein n=1 Tax=Agaricus bisporus var. burnettii TaxID=192524 RepID=A0A8H7F5N6_AGABI|nr:hypothetical protein Agabi119p4_3822 [Agaricus bisporus var. burnettii]